MSPVLGWRLDEALAYYRNLGFSVGTVEVSSKKGTDGSDARVLSEKRAGENSVVLYFACFVTELT